MERKTKRLPVSLSFGNFKCSSSEFLIPFTGGNDHPTGFMGIKTGKSFPYGALSFLGKEISTPEILDKLKSCKTQIWDAPAVVKILNRYLEKLQEFRIGNILEIEYLMEGDIRLIKIAERPPTEKGTHLP